MNAPTSTTGPGGRNREPVDDDRDDEEVQPECPGHEPTVRERIAKSAERNLEEGCVQQHRQNGGDESLEERRNRRLPHTDSDGECDRDRVDENLVALQQPFGGTHHPTVGGRVVIAHRQSPLSRVELGR